MLISIKCRPMCGSDHLDHSVVREYILNNAVAVRGRHDGRKTSTCPLIRRCVSRETLRRPCHVNGHEVSCWSTDWVKPQESWVWLLGIKVAAAEKLPRRKPTRVTYPS